MPFKRTTDMTRAVVLACAVALFPTFAFPLDKPVVPEKIAPQYQDAAEKRRAELVRQRACRERADKEKVMKRDLASFVLRCMDEAEKVDQAKTEQTDKK